MNTLFQISLCQLEITLGEPERNFLKGKQYVKEASRLGSSLIIFPELWLTGYDLENAHLHASLLNSGWFRRISDLARENRINIGGSILEIEGDRVYNTFTLVDPDGQLVAKYRKIHLFRLMEEDRWLSPGDSLCLAETNWGKAGISICYDLRFPEMFRQYALGNAQMFLISAEWPEARIEHWRTLLKARAIEDQVYVVACNRVGESKGETFGGHSAVIDPWGEMLVEAGSDEGLFTVDLDLNVLNTTRQKLAVFQDRRPDVYSQD